MQAIFGPFLLSCSSGFLASRDRVFSAPPLFALSQSFVHDAPKISFVTTKFGQDVPEEFRSNGLPKLSRQPLCGSRSARARLPR